MKEMCFSKSHGISSHWSLDNKIEFEQKNIQWQVLRALYKYGCMHNLSVVCVGCTFSLMGPKKSIQYIQRLINAFRRLIRLHS